MDGGVEDTSGQAPRPAQLKLERFLPHRLDVVSSIVSLALSPVCANFGLGLSEWRVLATLGAFGELNGKVVSRRTGMHKTAVSRIAQRLVARHLIQMRPNPADQRAVYLRLTAQGQQVYSEGWPLLVARARRIEEAIEPEDREAFNLTLLKLTEKAKQL